MPASQEHRLARTSASPQPPKCCTPEPDVARHDDKTEAGARWERHSAKFKEARESHGRHFRHCQDRPLGRVLYLRMAPPARSELPTTHRTRRCNVERQTRALSRRTSDNASRVRPRTSFRRRSQLFDGFPRTVGWAKLECRAATASSPDDPPRAPKCGADGLPLSQPALERYSARTQTRSRQISSNGVFASRAGSSRCWQQDVSSLE